MRLAWYAGASTGLATAVVASAFYQRANFYSAMVHLAQSSLSLMVLVNLVLVVYGSFMYGLQRICFGPLRPTEIEHLYEKAWFAVTETCLAMTIFREEVGAFFLVMFTALVTGKVWGWIGDGRVEVLEQQPPANPFLFHARLSLSLFVSIAYDIWLLSYAINTVVQDARPSMMVMFLFEFAVLTVCSLHTAARYIMSLVEQHVVKTQTRQRLEERRRRVREQREEILRRRETEGVAEDDNEELPDENDVDEMDIEVPGWEAKGQWVLSMDLVVDFIKLGIYTTFFCVLLSFYGLPIHIMRDWFMTTRSFLKRLHALIRYRQALKHMEQYPDATAEELSREDTCIICREEMRPWDPTDNTQVERSRAKKLPCGHTLHFGCLKSWLERQQVCPTCRRPVTRDGQPPMPNGPAVVLRLGLGGQNPNGQPQQPANGQAAPGAGQPAQGGAGGPADDQGNNQNRNVRMFNLGPLRLGFAQGGVEELMAQRMQLPADAVNPVAPTPTVPTPQEEASNTQLGIDELREQLVTLGNQVRQEMMNVHNAAHEIHVLSLLMNELTRIRQLQQQQQQPQGQQQATAQAAPPAAGHGGQAAVPHQQGFIQPPVYPAQQMAPPVVYSPYPVAGRLPAGMTRHVGAGTGPAIPAGSPDLPEGVVIPAGWSLLPLHRHDGEAPPSAPPTDTALNAQPLAQDVFRSVFANHPRSRGTSPAPLSGLAHLARSAAAAASGGNPAEASRRPVSRGSATATGTNTSEASRRPVSRGSTAPETAVRRQPPVTAPIPRAPNWGGSAQLFGGDRATQPPFGYQIEPTQGQHDEQGESSGSGAAVAATETNGVAPAESSAGSGTEASLPGAAAEATDAAEATEVNGSTGPRAATVEEAADDEDES